ncbi:MAG: glycosyltransferase [Desulfobacteraceae bacterium]|nr:glycosyltransferase [Desulfobacteraceae bacterium]
MIRVMHIITDLDTGGAEMMLYKLVSVLDREKFLCRVVSLEPPGVLSQRINNLGIQVDSLGVDSRLPNPLALFKAIQMVRKWRPQVVQTWMYHADLLGTLASRIAGRGVLVWNMRCTNMDFSQYSKTTRWVMRACAALSPYPHMVLANSHASIEYHKKMGYKFKRSMVIPNGFDLDQFRPDPLLRAHVRHELSIPHNAPCVGLVARFDPMKDHATFFSAAELIARKRPDTHFILCGEGMIRENPRVRNYLKKSGTSLNVHLLGRREDINRIMAGLDIFVLASSYGESFPNVVGEAMASGVPCVVTDVGDAAIVVADTGKVVPFKNPPAMAAATLGLLELPAEERKKLGMSARERVRKQYSLDKVATDYERSYLEAVVTGAN